VPGTLIVWREQSISSDRARRAHKIILLKSALLAGFFLSEKIKLFHAFLLGRMARGGHKLPKVSPKPALPFSSTPCGQATPEVA
jgi:hypothetical protein